MTDVEDKAGIKVKEVEGRYFLLCKENIVGLSNY